MTGAVSPRAWLTAVLAALLLLLAPVGHAQAASAQGKAVAQAATAHDAVVVAPSTRPTTGRTASVQADVTSTESPAGPAGAYRSAPQVDHAAQSDHHTAPARAPPLKD